jgi:hypothetical protein
MTIRRFQNSTAGDIFRDFSYLSSIRSVIIIDIVIFYFCLTDYRGSPDGENKGDNYYK